MTTKCKLSIIIPVYNCASFLHNCINSIMALEIKPFEVILIDDGSSDNSLKICMEYSQRHANVTVLSQTHSGISHARNNGLLHANGEYIFFCDADDELIPKGIENILRTLPSDTDLIVGNVYKKNAPFIAQTKMISAKDAIQKFFRHDNQRLLGTTYGKLFRSSIIGPKTRQPILFDEHIAIGEDALFVLQYLSKCKKICMLNDYMYKHTDNPNGIMASKCIQDYSTALLASKEMIRICLHEYDQFLTPAVYDLLWVYIKILRIGNSLAEAEAVREQFMSILSSLDICINIYNLPMIMFSAHGELIYNVNCQLNKNGVKVIFIDATGLHVGIMPALINTHIHLEDYFEKPIIKKYACTEEFLQNKIIGKDVIHNIQMNLDLCASDGCLSVIYTHRSHIDHPIVKVLSFAKSPICMDFQYGWMINDITKCDPNDIFEIFDLSRKLSKPVFLHLSSSLGEDARERDMYEDSFISFLHQRGLLTNLCFFVHGCYLRDDELKIISKCRGNIIICPLTEYYTNEQMLDICRLNSMHIQWFVGSNSQSLTGTCSLLQESLFLAKQYPHKNIAHQILHNITTQIVSMSKAWKRPLTQDYVLVDLNGIALDTFLPMQVLSGAIKTLSTINSKIS
ncbi:MAG: glycosyltransferase [Bacteroides sp.]|nr:glycosyltransferase [Bacteroides sp.]